MKCTCTAHQCAPGCDCGHSDQFHRFPVRRITDYKRECPAHAHLFEDTITLGSALRYGD
ncbi:hypothetical protein SAMN05428985_11057 [Nocardioides sp. YR527]|nr:hypothetical protein SAMN05428985_11057 [Nocardioides sp. YR527]